MFSNSKNVKKSETIIHANMIKYYNCTKHFVKRMILIAHWVKDLTNKAPYTSGDLVLSNSNDPALLKNSKKIFEKIQDVSNGVFHNHAKN